MKLQQTQIEKLCQKILGRLKEKDLIVFKSQEPEVLKRMVELIENDLRREDVLNAEVQKMLDDLESQNPGLDRRKMFSLLKQKLAKERKIVL